MVSFIMFCFILFNSLHHLNALIDDVAVMLKSLLETHALTQEAYLSAELYYEILHLRKYAHQPKKENYHNLYPTQTYHCLSFLYM